MLGKHLLCRVCCSRSLNVKYSKVRWKGSQNSVEEASPLRRLLNDASEFGETQHEEGDLAWATQPYAAHPAGEEPPSRVDPRETTVILFPGQGSQFVGMGQQLMKYPAAKELYELASSVVGWDVARVCMAGPAEELTARCQTAVLVTSLAALERVRDERPAALERVRAVAGFSLGEITALVFAGALTFEGALRLVEVRTEAMRAAAARRAGGLLTAWLAADARLAPALHAAREHAAAAGLPDPVCQVANYLFPGCKVIAGDEQALQFLEREGRGFGFRRTARVAGCGAWHSALVAGAAPALRAALARQAVAAPRVRALAAAAARAYGDAAHVRRTLAQHVWRPVRWEQTLQALYARARSEPQPLTLALGPGRALRATLRQVNARAWDASLQIDV